MLRHRVCSTRIQADRIKIQVTHGFRELELWCIVSIPACPLEFPLQPGRRVADTIREAHSPRAIGSRSKSNSG